MAGEVKISWSDTALRLLATDPAVLAGMDRVTAQLVSEMKRRCPVSPVYSGHESGHLRSSVRAFRQGNDSVIIGPTADYAKFVVEGTRPHIIRAHGDYSLHNRATGRYFGRVVHHPGTAPNPFVTEAAQEIAARNAGRRV
ncbi:MAG: HK97 gp10 family phage protein [Streptosporangiaceae bacterium]